MKKYDIFYQGGSGGFIFYECLMIALGTPPSIKWQNENFAKWKETEISKLEVSEYVSLYCNASSTKDAKNTSLLVYTDCSLQADLAYLKKAYWFQQDDTPLIRNMLSLYNGIKDITWPAVNSVEDMSKLSEDIRDEISSKTHSKGDPTLYSTWFTEFTHGVEKVPGTEYISELAELLNTVDHKFLLQDVVRTRFKCVTDELEIPYTNDIKDRINLWLNLHPQEIQNKLLGIK